MGSVPGKVQAANWGDSLGVALKGSRKSAICSEPGGSKGSFGTRGRCAKLTVNTNNQSARPIQWLAPAKGRGRRQVEAGCLCSSGSQPLVGPLWCEVGVAEQGRAGRLGSKAKKAEVGLASVIQDWGTLAGGITGWEQVRDSKQRPCGVVSLF